MSPTPFQYSFSIVFFELFVDGELPTHARGDGMDFGSQLLLYLYIKLIIAYIQLLVAISLLNFFPTMNASSLFERF